LEQTPLTVAIPKGKLQDDVIPFLKKIDFPTDKLEAGTRKLLLDFPGDGLRYIICRPADIPTYVEYGASDLGIVGKDTIVEARRNIFELVDLGFGRCKFVLALPKKMIEALDSTKDPRQILSHFSHLRVATKFPNVTMGYFEGMGLQAEIIHLHGNIELAPQVGLAEAIVDIVSTGKTLRENDLVAVDDIFEATARLVANRVSYRLKHSRIQELVEKIKSDFLEVKND